MKISLADLPPHGAEIPCWLSRDEAEARLAELEGEQIRLAGPVSAQLKLERSGERIVVRGRVRTALRLVCARCLEEFDYPLQETLFLVFCPVSEGAEEEEVAAEALSLEFYTGEEIDLWPVVREQVVLGLPQKPICREGCQGLCPVCGRSLNLGSCGCRVESGHPGLAALAQLRDKLPHGGQG